MASWSPAPDRDPDAGILDQSAPRERLGQLERHNLWHRWIALALAVIIIIGLAQLEHHILHLMREEWFWKNDLAGLLAVSPIIAITAIVVFLLLGAFRGHSDDIRGLPIDTLTKTIQGD